MRHDQDHPSATGSFRDSVRLTMMYKGTNGTMQHPCQCTNTHFERAIERQTFTARFDLIATVSHSLVFFLSLSLSLSLSPPHWLDIAWCPSGWFVGSSCLFVGELDVQCPLPTYVCMWVFIYVYLSILYIYKLICSIWHVQLGCQMKLASCSTTLSVTN